MTTMASEVGLVEEPAGQQHDNQPEASTPDPVLSDTGPMDAVSPTDIADPKANISTKVSETNQIDQSKMVQFVEQALSKVEEMEKGTSSVKELRELLKSASRDINETGDEGATAATHSQIGGKMKLIPELRYVPWYRAADNRDARDQYEKDGVYHTIDVPANEPDAADYQSVFARGWCYDSRGEKLEDGLSVPDYLPERIQINSRKFVYFLAMEVCNESLRFGSDTCFTVLRPFKMLTYIDQKLRSRVQELRHTLTEAERAVGLDEAELESEVETWPWRGTQEEDPKCIVRCIRNFNCLLEFIDRFLKPEQARMAAGPDEVRFADLCFLYPRGSLVYVKDSKVPHKIWRVVQATGGRRYLFSGTTYTRDYLSSFSPFKLDCFFLDYDGIRFVPVYQRFEVAEFAGMQSVKLLPILPLSVAERDRNLVDRDGLLDRGRQFVECSEKTYLHLEYSGRSQHLTPNGTKLVDLVDTKAPNARSALCHPERIDSEVVVDFNRAMQAVPGWRPETSQVDLYEISPAEVGGPGIDNDSIWDRKMSAEFLEAETQKWHSWEVAGSAPSEDEDLLLLPDRVFGFVLFSRQWACLKIGKGPDGKEQLRERVRQDDPWEKLQLPDGHKELVQSLISTHFARAQSQTLHFDLLRHKGKGVIILLHGVPGVGKTSTAECVSISTDRPLLPITCGDLGLTPREVEDKLKETFRLAQDWGFFMILDEADVFLAQRSVTDPNRNALVSVFLRTLEYYEGILFLTTNRVGVFDEAFKSRIHMALYYPPLTSPQTVLIWQRHIAQARQTGIRVNEGSLLSFAGEIYALQSKAESSAVWNGRQIRNAFQSAIALAAYHAIGEPISLDRKYFEDVFRVSNQFSAYIWETKNYQSDADRNRIAMIRRDNFEYRPHGTNEMTPQSHLHQQSQQNPLLSTYGQDAPRSAPGWNSHVPQPLHGSPQINSSMYPANPQQQFTNMQAATMSQKASAAPEFGGREFPLRGQSPQHAGHFLQPQQPAQYPVQEPNYGSAQSAQLPPDQAMFRSTYGSSLNAR